MSTREPTPSPPVLACVTCGHEVEECAACQEAGCGAGICFTCLLLKVGQAIPQPHRHGG